MNRKIISLIIFLAVVALIVPGVSAFASYAPGVDPNFPALHKAAASPGCADGCHTSAATWPDNFCGRAGCHATNPFAAPPTLNGTIAGTVTNASSN